MGRKWREHTVGEYRLGQVGGEACVVWWEGEKAEKKRRRFRLGVYTEEEGRQRLDDFARARAKLTAQEPTTVDDLMAAYAVDLDKDGKGGHRIVVRGKALAPMFGKLRPSEIDKDLCIQYAKERGKTCAPWTIYGELSALRSCMNWAKKSKILKEPPHIWLPKKPDPNDRWITQQEAMRLIGATDTPHVKLFIILAIATAGRRTALLELTWDRVDFKRRIISLMLEDEVRRVKRRATVPINDMLMIALEEAKAAAQSDHVIEYACGAVKSVRTGFERAVRRAGLEDVTPHVLRHSAAVWMAEADESMWAIAQFLGHSDSRITEQVYARYSPNYLRKAASALDLPMTRKLRVVS
jgi:integrase